ncbi:fungal fucose-specific lectin domain-containing protein [Trichoderma ceciliae]
MATQFTINARSAVAATAISASSFRVYFQDSQNGIREAIYDGQWTTSNDALFTAKRSTPLSVISWDEGKQVRIYCISADGLLEEWCCGTGGIWAPGYLTSLKVRTAPNTSIAAVNWDGASIRVYCQEETSNAIQEFCPGNPWKRGATLPIADEGSNLAATSWKHNGKVHLRVYYQAPDLSLKEHCYDGGWGEGGFNPGIALKNSAIAATSWINSEVQLRLYWQDSHGLMKGNKWTGSWESTGSISSVPVGTHISAVNWNNGSNIRIYYQSYDGSISEECNDSVTSQVL